MMRNWSTTQKLFQVIYYYYFKYQKYCTSLFIFSVVLFDGVTTLALKRVSRLLGTESWDQTAVEMANIKGASLRGAQLTIFFVLFTGYASYNYNRRSFSFAIPSLLTTGLLDKSSAGN